MTLTWVRAGEQPLAGHGRPLSDGAYPGQLGGEIEPKVEGECQRPHIALTDRPDENPKIYLLEAERQSGGAL